jgi:hypothetical protein
MAEDSGSSSSSSGGSSSGDDGNMGTPCIAHEGGVDLTTPTISFKDDVLPLFERSCGLSSSCHYDPGPGTISTLGIFLGCDINFDAGAQSTNSCKTANPGPIVYQDLVGSPDGGDAGPLPPLEITGMPYVTPGDPSKSYIMHKLDNDQCIFTTCVTMNMPVTTMQDTPGAPGVSNWCGASMPLNSDLLPDTAACGGTGCNDPAKFSRNTVRAWIAQGALNN